MALYMPMPPMPPIPPMPPPMLGAPFSSGASTMQHSDVVSSDATLVINNLVRQRTTRRGMGQEREGGRTRTRR